MEALVLVVDRLNYLFLLGYVNALNSYYIYEY